MKKKISPELRERIRRTNEEGRLAREKMQAIIDRVEARMREDEERRERRRRLFRRLLLLDH